MYNKVLLILLIFSFCCCQSKLESNKQVVYKNNSLFDSDNFFDTELTQLHLKEQIITDDNTEIPERDTFKTLNVKFGKEFIDFDYNNESEINNICSRETYFLILGSYFISEITPSFINLSLDNDIVLSLNTSKVEKLKDGNEDNYYNFIFELNNEQINILQKHNILSFKFIGKNISREMVFEYKALNESFNANGTRSKPWDFPQLLKGSILFVGNKTMLYTNEPKLPVTPYPHTLNQRRIFQDNHLKKRDSLASINNKP
jgi:hypothetical protein